MTTLADRIDALLPQTQCTRCGYPACRPYAEAVASGEAGLNQCAPGGDALIISLAHLLSRAVQPLSREHGPQVFPQVAVIDETTCIGCAKCIKACPVDAIIGARKLMHTVIEDWCTGCELCIPPCPVDCIRMESSAAFPDADFSRRNYDNKQAREARDKTLRDSRLAERDAQ